MNRRRFSSLTLSLMLSLMLSLAVVHAADGHSTTIVIDGSSTVYPITVAIGERYGAQNPTATIEVLCSGTTAGFRRLIAGEVPISGASRPIKADELAKATKAGIEIIELPVAFDGISVVVNKRNTFVDALTVAELKKIWEPDSTIKNWRQVRPSFPDLPIVLFGPGKDSGTFDYFTEVIVGTARSSRSDYTGSEDDNVLVQGVERNAGALGYFGLSYFRENEALLKAVAIDGGSGPIMPATETVTNGTYRPLSRPLFLYVNKAAMARAEVRQFIEAYLKMVPSFAPQVGCVAFEPRIYEFVRQRLTALTTGSIFVGARSGAQLGELLAANHKTAEPIAAPPSAVEKKPTETVIIPLPVASQATTASSPPSSTVVKATAAKTTTPRATAVVPTVSTSTAATIQGERMNLKSLDAQRLDLLRARAISMARLTLEESASLDEISTRIEELRLLTTSMRKAHAPLKRPIPQDQAEFTALVERLQLTNEGRSVLSDQAFAQLKMTLVAVTDAALRHRLATALLRPGPDQLPDFTSAISEANGGRADVDAILCFARGGFIIP